MQVGGNRVVPSSASPGGHRFALPPYEIFDISVRRKRASPDVRRAKLEERITQH
jgi:hypothetical protein